MNNQKTRLDRIKQRKQELLNLKEALLLIKSWTVPDIEQIKEQNKKDKAKVLSLYPRR